jgi:hypothetical protein
MWNNEIFNHELSSELHIVNFERQKSEIKEAKLERIFDLPNNQFIFNLNEINLRGRIKNHVLFLGACFDFLSFQQVFRKFSDQKIILIKETITTEEEELAQKNNFIIFKCRYNNLEDLKNCAIEESHYVFCTIENDNDFKNKNLLRLFDENFKDLNYLM